MAHDSFCKFCGKKFLKTTKNIKYCSLECSIKYNKQRQYKEHHENKKSKMELRECVYCKEKYLPRSMSQKYCKRECQIKDHNLKWTTAKH